MPHKKNYWQPAQIFESTEDGTSVKTQQNKMIRVPKIRVMKSAALTDGEVQR